MVLSAPFARHHMLPTSHPPKRIDGVSVGVSGVGLQVGRELSTFAVVEKSQDAISEFRDHSNRASSPWCPSQTENGTLLLLLPLLSVCLLQSRGLLALGRPVPLPTFIPHRVSSASLEQAPCPVLWPLRPMCSLESRVAVDQSVFRLATPTSTVRRCPILSQRGPPRVQALARRYLPCQQVPFSVTRYPSSLFHYGSLRNCHVGDFGKEFSRVCPR